MTQPSTSELQKAIQPAVKYSVETPEQPGNLSPSTSGAVIGDRFGIFAIAAGYSDGIPEWGTVPTLRDAHLRAFLPREAFAASAFSAVVAKNAQMSWKIEGGSRVSAIAQEMLLNAEWGGGWHVFISKLWMDVLTQDKGGFVELVRAEDSPSSPVIHLKTLDAACCWATGVPEFPVIYYDRVGGKYHRLKWYQVYQVQDTPVHHQTFYGLQYSAMTRVLKAAQLYRNVRTYFEEKSSGRFTRAIHVIGGIGKKDLADAMALQQETSNQQMLTRYIQPVVMAAIDPEHSPSIATIELATMPDQFDPEQHMKEYITVLALALGTDYGELAPLPGGGLGTATQSTVMDDKSKQKGTGLFRKLIEQMINRAVLPANVEFSFDELDKAEEQKDAEIRVLRAQGRGFMRQNGEVDDAGARQLALDAGDISPELFAAMNERDLTEESIRDDERQKTEAILRSAGGTAKPGAPTAPVNIVGIGNGQVGGPKRDSAQSQVKEALFTELQRNGFLLPSSGEIYVRKGDDRAGPEEERLDEEGDAADAVAAALDRIGKNVRRKLRAESKALELVAEVPREFTVHKEVQRDDLGRIIGITETHKEITEDQ